MEVQIEKTGKERYRWHILGSLPVGGNLRLSHSAVTFETMQEAADDFKAHVEAEAQGSRVVLPKEQVQRLVRAMTESCEHCSDTYFGAVYWHEPDASGCNWSVSTIKGEAWSQCIDATREHATELRARYLIPTEKLIVEK